MSYARVKTGVFLRDVPLCVREKEKQKERMKQSKKEEREGARKRKKEANVCMYMCMEDLCIFVSTTSIGDYTANPNVIVWIVTVLCHKSIISI